MLGNICFSDQILYRKQSLYAPVSSGELNVEGKRVTKGFKKKITDIARYKRVKSLQYNSETKGLLYNG